jgi:tRNA threonylcarbamoyladenosine biosynthesis protein TsaE
VSTSRQVKITSSSPRKTEQIGLLLGEILIKGDVIALSGELGTGKTTLVRGMAEGIGLEKEDVASPSFTLVNEYRGPLPLFHLDLYRLHDEKELLDVDFEAYIRGEGVVVIEWADRICRAIPSEALWIILQYIDNEGREIVVQGRGARYELIIEELQRRVYNNKL